MTDLAGRIPPVITRPTEHELAQARATFGRDAAGRPHTCGCIGQLLRNPFYAALESHWGTYHASSLPILRAAQADRLANVAARAAAVVDGRWPAA